MTIKIIPFFKFAHKFARRLPEKAIAVHSQADRFHSILQKHDINPTNAKILEIGGGIGNLCSYALAERNVRVVSLDIMETEISITACFKSLFTHNPIPTPLRDRIKNCLRILFCLPHRLDLQNSLYSKVNPQNIKLAKMSILKTSFPDHSFDGCYSSSVLEHIPNLEQAFKELKRILKPGAFGLHYWHPFTSLSGGHVTHDPQKPWAHLQGNSTFMSHGLNKLRYDQIIPLINKHFEIKKLEKHINGDWKKHLTKELREILSDYSEEELLTERVDILFLAC